MAQHARRWKSFPGLSLKASDSWQMLMRLDEGLASHNELQMPCDSAQHPLKTSIARYAALHGDGVGLHP